MSKCTWTIGDSKVKTARISPYDDTTDTDDSLPVILLRPEDMHARLNHQLSMRISDIDLEIHSYNNEL